jgi:hypothetical protein
MIFGGRHLHTLTYVLQRTHKNCCKGKRHSISKSMELLEHTNFVLWAGASLSRAFAQATTHTHTHTYTHTALSVLCNVSRCIPFSWLCTGNQTHTHNTHTHKTHTHTNTQHCQHFVLWAGASLSRDFAQAIRDTSLDVQMVLTKRTGRRVECSFSLLRLCAFDLTLHEFRCLFASNRVNVWSALQVICRLGIKR